MITSSEQYSTSLFIVDNLNRLPSSCHGSGAVSITFLLGIVIDILIRNSRYVVLCMLLKRSGSSLVLAWTLSPSDEMVNDLLCAWANFSLQSAGVWKDPQPPSPFIKILHGYTPEYDYPTISRTYIGVEQSLGVPITVHASYLNGNLYAKYVYMPRILAIVFIIIIRQS